MLKIPPQMYMIISLSSYMIISLKEKSYKGGWEYG